ncbi:hypothetical protein [Chitinophaga sp.]|uniref:hypothetical protein n=1 Tax=Chitinophaga sp. TaxID=1869181 RepID=UPI002C4FB5B3|nr:hypothetical protein [Chitinophaga sp.]HWV64612.1 hypothetical protein [Chitinophaga sp.]
MLVDNSQTLFFGGDLDNPFTSNIADGVRSLYAGNPYGFMDGTLTAAQFSSITGMPRNAVTGEMYVADSHAIRSITDSRVSGSLAGRGSSPVSGYDNGTLYNAINGICVDKERNIYIVERHGKTVRKVVP